jgi:hypothetical protein
MFNFIYIYSFIPMSGCVGMGPSAPLFNLYCLFAEISKQQRYRSILHMQTLSTAFWIITIEAGPS